MEWMDLPKLDISGAAAAVINRRIDTHLKFRAQIDSGDPAATKIRTWVKVDGKPSPVETDRTPMQILEALRREYFIRYDTIVLLKEKGIDPSSESTKLAQVAQMIKEMS